MAETSDLAAKLSGWFDAYAGALALYARQWGEVGEDAVQEAFVSLAAWAAHGREPSNVKAWLYVSVRNAAMAARRSDVRRRRRERETTRGGQAWFEPKPDDLIDATAAEAALSQLPSAQREIVVLRLWSGMTLAEISDVVNLPISTLHDQYRAALAAIRAAMSRKESQCRNLP